MMARPHRDSEPPISASLTWRPSTSGRESSIDPVARAPVVDAETPPRSDQTKAVASRSRRQAFSCFQTFPSSQE
jgi:hypothetical protein